jgi:UPF0271 protein
MINYVLDACAFITGINPSSIEGRVYSVPAIAEELPRGSMAFLRFNTSQEAGHLTVMAPSSDYLERIVETSKELGESKALSKADLQVIALALELKSKEQKPTIVTDDYAIQNVAEHLELNYSSLATLGIVYEFNWTIYCPACFKEYQQEYRLLTCEVCGTKLKRKVRKKLDKHKSD